MKCLTSKLCTGKAALFFLLWPAPATPTVAQEQDAPIARAAVEYLSRELVKLPVTIDPHVLSTAPGLPRVEERTSHTPAFRAATTIQGIATVVSMEQAVSCRIPVAPMCKTNGYAVFVVLGRPVVKNDSATIDLWVRSARDLTPADSATIRERHIRGETRMRDPSYRGLGFNIYDSTKSFDRLERTGHKVLQFTLVRAGGNWQVTSTKILGQS